MKKIFVFFALLVLSSALVSASEHKESREILLKKDEQKDIFVKYADKKKLFTLRWTLYKDDALVIFRSYDKIVAQNVLSLRHENQSFRLELMPKGGKNPQMAYLLVKFKEFKESSKEVLFEVFLFDKNAQIELEDLK
ncbi:MAG: hypothetical protein OEL19_05150 [Sulfurimonas sp.]|nr:hypothetical protein [Sulfurimonas sp.]